jgi:ABC-type transport system substrate-binding protein
MIIDQLVAGSGVALATCVGPGFGPFYDPNLKADAYDPQQAADLLKAAGYSVSITPPAKIESVGTPILGQSVKVKGYTSVAGMIVIVQQSSDQQTWSPVSAAAADISGNYEVSVPGPPVLGSVWYRANFTGYALNETLAGTSFSADQANSYINEGASIGNRRLVPESLTDPLAISSVTNDAAVVLAVVIVLIVIAVVAMRRKKPETPTK